MTPTYEFYTGVYRGSQIPSDEWDGVAAQATDMFKHLQRLYTITEPQENAIDKAICAIAEEIHRRELIARTELEGGASSVSIGSVSTSYKTPSAGNLGVDMTDSGAARAYYRAAQRHVMIYRGAK